MPETSMPPPKQHGGGAFIGAVIVMLLAMGGLLFWKFRGKEPPPPIPSAQPIRTAAPTFAEAPPPPPPAEPDSGTKASPTKKHAIVSSGNGGCSAVCRGDAPAALRAALAGSARSARGCYERALRQNQMLQGKLVVAVKIGPHGNPCGASLASDSLGDASVSSCVLQKFRAGSFPPPVGGCADVKIPILFTPKK